MTLVIESLAYSTLQGGPEFTRWLAASPTGDPAAARPVVAARAPAGGRALAITLDRPQVRNALNAAVAGCAVRSLSLVRADPSIRTVRSFGDGAELLQRRRPRRVRHLDRSGPRPTSSARFGAWPLRLSAGGSPGHGTLHGACIGAGIELAGHGRPGGGRSDYPHPAARGGHGAHPRRRGHGHPAPTHRPAPDGVACARAGLLGWHRWRRRYRRDRRDEIGVGDRPRRGQWPAG